MTHMLASDDMARLARSAERLVRLAQAINDRAREGNPSTPAFGPPSEAAAPLGQDSLIQLARHAIRIDRHRPHFGAPALFQARSWTLLLELFIADASGTPTSVKAASLTLGGSQTSALRSILQLEQLDVVRSRADSTDGRRRLLSLSDRARSAVGDYLSRLQAEQQRPLRLSLRMTTQTVTEDGSDAQHSAGNYLEMTPSPAATESGAEMAFP